MKHAEILKVIFDIKAAWNILNSVLNLAHVLSPKFSFWKDF